MSRHKAFRYRVYPTPQQAARLTAWDDALRFLWNLANEQRLLAQSRVRDHRKYLSAYDQMKELRTLRRELPWLADVPSNVAGQMLIDLDTAWQRCFDRVSRAPRWKRKGRDSLSFTEAHSVSWGLAAGAIRFPKLGELRAVIHRPVEGKPKRCTLRREGDQWFACIVCELETQAPTPRTVPVVAIDRGITHLLADSGGKLTENPRFYAQTMKQLARAQRIVSRRKKGSKNREKAKVRVMRLHRKVRRQRAHVLHELSASYAKSHGVVVVEKLNTRGMIRSRFSRSIADAGWSRFATMLRYKLEWSGGTLVEVPAAYSSQTCSACGVVDAASRSGERFCCTDCDHTDHADLNAAKVLLSRANRSALPVEGTVPEAARRSRKAKTEPRKPCCSSRKAPIRGASITTPKRGTLRTPNPASGEEET